MPHDLQKHSGRMDSVVQGWLKVWPFPAPRNGSPTHFVYLPKDCKKNTVYDLHRAYDVMLPLAQAWPERVPSPRELRCCVQVFCVHARFGPRDVVDTAVWQDIQVLNLKDIIVS